MPIPKAYLGDAVYIEEDGYGGVILTTENGIEIQNTIYMEPFVIEAMLRYLERMKNEAS